MKDEPSSAIMWLGHGSMEIITQGKKILCDPWIEGNPSCNLSVDDITDADIVCVTHGHIDHIGDSLEIVRKTGALFICSPEIAGYADRRGLEYDKASYPMNIGGSWRSNGLTITMVHADHTSDIQEKDGSVAIGSGCCGFVISPENGHAIYFSGDTGVFGDMAIIRELYSPVVSILNMGGKYNMGVKEAAYAASLLQSRYLIPIHHGTFEDQIIPMDDFRNRVQQCCPMTQVIDLQPGGIFKL